MQLSFVSQIIETDKIGIRYLLPYREGLSLPRKTDLTVAETVVVGLEHSLQ
jgi:hypothetical protein